MIMGKTSGLHNVCFKYILSFLKWSFLSVVVGVLGGLVGTAFHKSVDFVTEIRNENFYLIFFLGLSGVIIAWIYNIFKAKGKLDTNRVFDAVSSKGEVPLVMAPLIFISTCITHLFGGSAGREGAALQLGGSIGFNVGKLLRLNENDIHTIVMAGMSSVFAALFGTPITAAIFVIEVTFVGVMHYASLVPSVISALSAYILAKSLGVAPVKFLGIEAPKLSALFLLKLVVLALLCALVGIAFCKLIHFTEHIFEKYLKNAYLRALLGGVLITVLTLVIGSTDYNGAGMHIIEKAISGESETMAFLLKMLFTAITIAAGFKGGEIVPTFFIGSTFGCVMGSLLGINPAFAAAVGFVALFCAVVNCPIASLILAIEVFGFADIGILALVIAIVYMMSGKESLYKSQKFGFSKTEETTLNLE